MAIDGERDISFRSREVLEAVKLETLADQTRAAQVFAQGPNVRTYRFPNGAGTAIGVDEPEPAIEIRPVKVIAACTGGGQYEIKVLTGSPSTVNGTADYSPIGGMTEPAAFDAIGFCPIETTQHSLTAGGKTPQLFAKKTGFIIASGTYQGKEVYELQIPLPAMPGQKFQVLTPIDDSLTPIWTYPRFGATS